MPHVTPIKRHNQQKNTQLRLRRDRRTGAATAYLFTSFPDPVREHVNPPSTVLPGAGNPDQQSGSTMTVPFQGARLPLQFASATP